MLVPQIFFKTFNHFIPFHPWDALTWQWSHPQVCGPWHVGRSSFPTNSPAPRCENYSPCQTVRRNVWSVINSLKRHMHFHISRRPGVTSLLLQKVISSLLHRPCPVASSQHHQFTSQVSIIHPFTTKAHRERTNLYSYNLALLSVSQRSTEIWSSQVGWYPPVNKHSNGKSPSWIGNTSSNGGFSIAMLDYRSVEKSMKVSTQNCG